MNGQYRNEETEVFIEIKHLTDTTYEITKGDYTNGAVMVSPNRLLMNNYILTIESNEAKIDNLLLSANHIQKVRFTRIK